MALVATGSSIMFVSGELKKRDLIRAQYHTWDAPRNGIVSSISDTVAYIVFLPDVHSASSYYRMTAQEVADGKWSVLYTTDMKTIKEVAMTYAGS